MVADTCVVLWLAFAPEQLSRAAARAVALARQEGGLAISGVTLYEIAWLSTHGRVDVQVPLDAFLVDVESRFIVLPVTAAIVRTAAELPGFLPGRSDGQNDRCDSR